MDAITPPDDPRAAEIARLLTDMALYDGARTADHAAGMHSLIRELEARSPGAMRKLHDALAAHRFQSVVRAVRDRASPSGRRTSSSI